MSSIMNFHRIHSMLPRICISIEKRMLMTEVQKKLKSVYPIDRRGGGSERISKSKQWPSIHAKQRMLIRSHSFGQGSDGISIFNRNVFKKNKRRDESTAWLFRKFWSFELMVWQTLMTIGICKLQRENDSATAHLCLSARMYEETFH